MKRKATEADRPEKKLRWDVPKTASLINFYKEHPELWNPRVPEYSNDKLRLKAIEAWLIENQLEPDKVLIGEVKLKLHGLRTSYGHELRMEATKVIDGTPYISKWQWYRNLSFLKEAMCFRARSGSMSSSANNSNSTSTPPGTGRRVTRRRGRRDPQSLPLQLTDDMDHNHNDFYKDDPNEMKIVAIEHSDNGTGHGYMIDPEYEHPLPPHAHQATHNAHLPPHHTQHQHAPPPGVVHMVHLEESPHHHISPGATDHIGQDPHVPVVTYRARETIQRNDSGSNLNLMCLAQATTPDNKAGTSASVSGEEVPRTVIPSMCNCKCRSPPQTVGEKLGRLVEETFSNLHAEYHDMARWEIQQILGKYLQKPIP